MVTLLHMFDNTYFCFTESLKEIGSVTHTTKFAKCRTFSFLMRSSASPTWLVLVCRQLLGVHACPDFFLSLQFLRDLVSGTLQHLSPLHCVCSSSESQTCELYTHIKTQYKVRLLSQSGLSLTFSWIYFTYNAISQHVILQCPKFTVLTNTRKSVTYWSVLLCCRI